MKHKVIVKAIKIFRPSLPIATVRVLDIDNLHQSTTVACLAAQNYTSYAPTNTEQLSYPAHYLCILELNKSLVNLIFRLSPMSLGMRPRLDSSCVPSDKVYVTLKKQHYTHTLGRVSGACVAATLWTPHAKARAASVNCERKRQI